MKRWHNSLLIQHVGYFSLLSLVTVVGLAIVIYYQSVELLKKSITSQMEVVISIKENQIDNWFSQQHKTILLIAQTPTLVNSYQNYLNNNNQQSYQLLQNYFNTILETENTIQSLSISTNSGIVSISTQGEEEGNYQPLGNTVTYFTKENLDTVRPTLYTSPVTRETAMTFATPLRNEQGERIGVLSVDLSLEKIHEIMQEATGLGETDEAYLIRKQGQENRFVDTQNTDLANEWVRSPGIDAVMSGQDGIDFYQNHQQVEVLGSYRWLEDKNLAILVEITQEEAFTVSGIIAKNLLLWGCFVSVILLLIVYFLSRKVTKPILKIAKNVNQVIDGNLTESSETLKKISQRRDEIGQLARGFDEMIKVVDSRQQNLAEQVRKLRMQQANLSQAQELEMAYFKALKRKAQWIRHKE
ncbi:cache domain-containing sensor histidine kinase [Roseofilum capinflatum]|uniref:histidine kinase n=1 Tax=Roseofilum capinflatum BLCC-M114 TaxID=3022440 RepID=A0ABT7BCC0_9CYAN|nr:sensor histidine kinase [Roseofilum capinflatum]MDJ1176239.1 cache domain-containing protein [Roseofilum capinflatum BLCC-M114]